jgi:hypothetical protein
MPNPDQILEFKEFSSGWCPSDDAVNGRKDGLLQMDNLELDKNGALSLSGGTSVLGSAYSYNAHTLGSNIISGTRYDYLADTNGGIFRNGSSIGTGGDSTNAAFASAFDFTLACSGSTRLKDSGSSTVPLGLTTPAGIGAAAIDGYISCTPFTGSSYTIVVIAAGSTSTAASAGHFGILGSSDTTTFNIIFQTTSGGASPSGDSTVFTATNATSTSIPYVASQYDYFVIEGIGFNWSQIDFIRVDILLEAGDVSGDVVADYFTQTYTVQGTESPSDQFLSLQRGNFTRVGSSNKGWGDIYDIRVTIQGNAAFTIGAFYFYWKMYAGALPGGSVIPSDETLLQFNTLGGAPGSQGYQFYQVNVNQTNSYQALSAISPASGVLYPFNNTIQILPYISGIEAQVNQIWIYATGGNIGGTPIKILTFLAANWTVPQYFATSDQQALINAGGVAPGVWNLNLVSINHSGIAAKIYDIIGPIQGRWWYFVNQFMYPSDINDPDLVNPSLGVRTAAGAAEIYLWARRVGLNQVIVGTSKDCYLLTGTFVTLPDGTIDVYYQSLGCKHPSISFDATFQNGVVFYLAADGWRSIDTNGTCELLVAPNTDRLYRGITCYGYSVNTKVIAGSTRFPVVLALNRLWCGITGQARVEVLDTVRKYWRNFSIQQGDVTAICSTQDGNVLAFFATDKKLRKLDVQSSLQIDGSTNQTVNLLTPVFDGGTPRQRKDLYTLKFRGSTGGSNLTISLIDDTNTITSLGTVSSSAPAELDLDISQLVARSKWFQLSATGTFSALTIQEFSMFGDTRPIPVTFMRLYNSNFGSASKKRLRVWPAQIDTLGNNVVFTPICDNSNLTTQTINTSDKTTVPVFIKTDAFGIDYGATLYAGGALFEFWGMLSPDIVQTLPIARRFDQVGPEELFRYGKIKELGIRVMAFGGTSIPYLIYFNDQATPAAGHFTVPDGQETTIEYQVPKGVAGSIVRIVLGPTSFNFHRFYLRVKVAKSGSDTENIWVQLPEPQGEV